ncbi:MAG TPA: DUF3768 domain-containing protein [Bryobacteraceae bacterium]|nr:DUF3768 domain-containing protein [Bryobacteraceae bacterium]
MALDASVSYSGTSSWGVGSETEVAMNWFVNHYRCGRCAKEWHREWFAASEDDCPHCGARHMFPHKSDETPTPQKGDSAKIAQLNDAFRKSLRGGKVMLTASVTALPESVRVHALLVVNSYDKFTPDNDPYNEHDFGSFELIGRTFFWKIDYYDELLKRGSENPADPEKTTRVLTLMLAEDY